MNIYAAIPFSNHQDMFLMISLGPIWTAFHMRLCGMRVNGILVIILSKKHNIHLNVYLKNQFMQ